MQIMWLLKSEVFTELRAAMSGGLRTTTEQQAQFVATRGRPQSSGDVPGNDSAAGDVAQINVLGVLAPRPSFLLWLLGYEQTSYSDIQRSLALAASDTNVKRVAMVVDSPGGQVDGVFETLAAIEAFEKPIAVSASCACSAAYAIAAAAGPITATNAAAEFGSIGVAASVVLDDDVVDITSTEAPNKRPDASTPEGQAVIREHLDAIHELFAYEYLSTATNRLERRARQLDSDEAGAVLENAAAPSNAAALDNSDLVAAAMGLTPPRQAAAPGQTPSRSATDTPIDNADLVARAMGLSLA